MTFGTVVKDVSGQYDDAWNSKPCNSDDERVERLDISMPESAFPVESGKQILCQNVKFAALFIESKMKEFHTCWTE